MMIIGSSVDYVRSGGMRNVPVTKAGSGATTAKFSGFVLLVSRPANSYPPRRAISIEGPSIVHTPKLRGIQIQYSVHIDIQMASQTSIFGMNQIHRGRLVPD
ncbi:hypothetical protein AVEN_186126-1 [Araneus ventricosus]|uniref:Uncharacterized protein n=1 Tax=Araneus ventricosus TaxID=182803 RepID=A0A4Y2HDD8_ARAVE|nr:hypothetical protein AVEN_186126-1 [Araneus ventricosus]